MLPARADEDYPERDGEVFLGSGVRRFRGSGARFGGSGFRGSASVVSRQQPSGERGVDIHGIPKLLEAHVLVVGMGHGY